MLSAVAMTASRVSRCSEWIAVSVPPPALSRRDWSRERGHHPACSALHPLTSGNVAVSQPPTPCAYAATTDEGGIILPRVSVKTYPNSLRRGGYTSSLVHPVHLLGE